VSVPTPAPPTPTARRTPLIATKTGRELVLAASVATMVVEMAWLILDLDIPFGNLVLSASALPMIGVILLLGSRGVGMPEETDRVVPFWIAMVAGLILGLALFARTGDALDVVGLLIAAVNEEVVYRFAVPLVITAALMVVRVPVRPARFVGYLVAGGWWILLPGHQAQTQTVADLGTYVAFAIISALVVSRSRALVPMSVAHCVLNVITFAHLRGDITTGSRMALSACLLFLLVGTYAWPEKADDGPAVDDGDDLISDTVIDLRDGHRPSVVRDGEITWIADPSAPEPSAAAPSAGTGSAPSSGGPPPDGDRSSR